MTLQVNAHHPRVEADAADIAEWGAVLATAVRHLTDVDDALARIADGTYGRCDRCDEPIFRERLFARPAARTCITCAD